MAKSRCLPTLTRRALSLFSPTPLESPPSLNNLIPSKSILHLTPLVDPPSRFIPSFHPANHHRHFSSTSRNHTGAKADDEKEEISEGEDDGDEEEDVTASASQEYTPEEKEAEAAVIGYKVVGPLHPSDRVFKAYEPVFAVVQIGSHQFKVSNGDCIFTERLKFCEVNDKLILNKVLLLGSSTQTIVGRPTIPDAAVHAVVEEHALDAKVIIFKKKRRKNYRRTKGHRQELTQLRITDIQGIEKPEKIVRYKPEKTDVKNEENFAVAA